jgi:hypothetical protein
MILHGYDLDEIRRYRESFQQLHRKASGKLGLNQLADRYAARIRGGHEAFSKPMITTACRSGASKTA